MMFLICSSKVFTQIDMGGAERGWGRGWLVLTQADALDRQSDGEVTAVPTDWSNQLKSRGGPPHHPHWWHAARSNDYWSSWGARGMWGGGVLSFREGGWPDYPWILSGFLCFFVCVLLVFIGDWLCYPWEKGWPDYPWILSGFWCLLVIFHCLCYPWETGWPDYKLLPSSHPLPDNGRLRWILSTPIQLHDCATEPLILSVAFFGNPVLHNHCGEIFTGRFNCHINWFKSDNFQPVWTL